MAWWRFGKKKEKEQATESPSEARAENAGGTLAKLKQGLRKTAAGLRGLIGLRRGIDDALIDELEVKLYEADFGPQLVPDLVEEVRKAWKSGEIDSAEKIGPFLKERLLDRLAAHDTSLVKAPSGPTVILVVGVNGTGKTTSIAKLAHQLAKGGSKVLLAAADTFRAAATEQLQRWAERINLPLVTGREGQDPASVAYAACDRAVSEGYDYLIVDTAGRLHTQVNLMRELEKVRRVIARKIEGAPHEVLLVLDATVGQNAISQAEAFNRALNVTGLILAKLDGTAKGGIVVTLNNRFQIPVKFVGIGESVEDLAPFSAEKFVQALFD